MQDDHRLEREAQLDETVEESFPASDAPANTVVTGTNPAPALSSDAARAGTVTDNVAASRLEMTLDGEVAVLNYERGGGTFVLLHTEVPAAIRGRRIGETLVKAGLAAARREGLRTVIVCPFAKALLRRHPDMRDQTAPDAPLS